MRICFVGDFDIRERYAAPLAHLHAAAGLRRLGHDVTLVLPRPRDLSSHNAQGAFLSALNEAAITESFPLAQIPRITAMGRGGRSYALLVAVWAKAQRFDLLWARYLYAADFASWLGIPSIAEHHLFLSNKQIAATRRMMRRSAFKALVTISEAHKRELMERYGLSGSRMVVGHSAVDIRRFQVDLDRGTLRQRLGLPTGPLVMYSGSLYRGRGIEQVFEVAHRLSQVTIVCVGGPNAEARRFSTEVRREGLHNLLFCGRVLQREVPCYLAAADVLILPHSTDARAVDGTPLANIASPLKLFEYMAIGRPIVASALGPVMEVLQHGKSGLLVPPGDSGALAAEIETLLEKPELARSLAEAARLEARKYTWEARAVRIMAHAGYKPETLVAKDDR